MSTQFDRAVGAAIIRVWNDADAFFGVLSPMRLVDHLIVRI